MQTGIKKDSRHHRLAAHSWQTIQEVTGMLSILGQGLQSVENLLCLRKEEMDTEYLLSTHLSNKENSIVKGGCALNYFHIKAEINSLLHLCV